MVTATVDTCRVDSCDRALHPRGLCHSHYMRQWRYGDPLYTPPKIKRLCQVGGCGRPHRTNGYCVMHYERVRAHGDPGPVGRLIAPAGTGHVALNGYRVIKRRGHPLAGAQDKVYEHRVVLYEAIGPGDHPCHWCGMRLRWGGTWPQDTDAITIDHLDNDTLHNEPENLVPSCNECNTQRNRRAS